ncbi:MAG: nickel pincer cofactor biosynthesis protein LarC [candidate division NC10 bacterium]|nr:nickel pincer cofactor biosynthesis protein LarC [candidate division NC10 bacterium]
MRIGYFDCWSGVSGDMILGALVDAGLELERLQAAISGLGVPGIQLAAEQMKRGAFVGTKVHVRTEEQGHSHRRLPDIEAILDRANLPEPVRADARRIFRRLAEAEATVHGTTPDRIHFHEVGALDALADVVGAAWGIRQLGLARIHVSPINLGSGFIQAAHGKMPVPAPGTAALLTGVPAYGSEIPVELTTPTGAAILTTLAATYGPMPAMTIRRVAYGAGHHDLKEQPNLLRLIIGELSGDLDRDQVTVLEATIDDMNPQFFEPLMDRLFEAGALDVFLSPVIMKKSRPGTTLTVLAEPAIADQLAALILTHSSTFGVRAHTATRWKLFRDFITVSTTHGSVRVKRGWSGDRITILSPEYEDCRRVSQATGVPIQAIYDEARQAAARAQGAGSAGVPWDPEA